MYCMGALLVRTNTLKIDTQGAWLEVLKVIGLKNNKEFRFQYRFQYRLEIPAWKIFKNTLKIDIQGAWLEVVEVVGLKIAFNTD